MHKTMTVMIALFLINIAEASQPGNSAEARREQLRKEIAVKEQQLKNPQVPNSDKQHIKRSIEELRLLLDGRQHLD